MLPVNVSKIKQTTYQLHLNQLHQLHQLQLEQS